MNKSIHLLLVCILFNLFSCQKQNEKDIVNYNVHTFYYNWYGNEETDEKYFHWSHDILPHWSDKTWDNAGTFPGQDDIGANFYPQLGNYSSNDVNTIRKHMQMMKDAGIGVFVITWWGKDSYEDKSIKLYLDVAKDYGLKLAFHIEPFYKNAEEFKAQLTYIVESYGQHPALYRYNNKPFYYVYDSYKLDVSEWRKLFTDDGELSVRNTDLDGTFIGLWVHKDEGAFFTDGGFDGFYSYFASNGFVYGSTTTNWQVMMNYAKENKLLFIPSVGPGYIDTRIRPWNGQNIKERKAGAYYENMFQAALDVHPEFISITSFNEWHEGTQIEPAISKSFGDYTYEDYGDQNPYFYIEKTKELVSRFGTNLK